MRRMILFMMALSVTVVANEGDDAAAKLYEYFGAFNAKDVVEVANHIYSTPVHIAGGDSHRVLANPDAAIRNLVGLYGEIEARGWKESVIEDLKICQASDTLALVDARYSRIDHDGNPIPPTIRTTLYVLQKIDDVWRIVAFYGHAADKRPSCGPVQS